VEVPDEAGREPEEPEELFEEELEDVIEDEAALEDFEPEEEEPEPDELELDLVAVALAEEDLEPDLVLVALALELESESESLSSSSSSSLDLLLLLSLLLRTIGPGSSCLEARPESRTAIPEDRSA
jgi:hypothetical protein